MKTLLITAAVSIAIGFACGWMVRSASQDLESVGKEQHSLPETRTPAISTLPQSEGRPVPPARPQPRPDGAEQVIDMDPSQLPESALRLDQAKWLRLAEVLNLNVEQSQALAANILEVKPLPDMNNSPDVAYEKAGKELEQRVLSVLTPEQQEEFRKFQQRSMENLAETKAQETFSQELAELDLSAAQREQALEILRQQADAEVATISPATRLVLSGSILPIGNEKFSDEGVLLSRKLKTAGDTPTMEDLAEISRAEIQERISRFEGILTPGQTERYHAALGESLENLELLSPRQ